MSKDTPATPPQSDGTTDSSTVSTNDASTTPTVITSLIQWQDLPTVISVGYYLNPTTVLSTIVRSSDPKNENVCFQNIITLLILHTLHVSTKQRSELSLVYISFLMSILTYIDCHYMILLIPVALLVAAARPHKISYSDDHHNDNSSKQQPTRTVIVPMVVLYTVFTTALHILAGILVGFNYYPAIFVATHLHTFQITNLQPNLSLLWYFGMEVFVPFHRYFTFLLGGLPYFTVVPMTIRLYRYPSVLVRSIERINCIRWSDTTYNYSAPPFLI